MVYGFDWQSFGIPGNLPMPDMNMMGTPMGGFGMSSTFGYGFPDFGGDMYAPSSTTSSSSKDKNLSYEEKKQKALEKEKFKKEFQELKSMLKILYDKENGVLPTSTERESLKYDVEHHSSMSGDKGKENYAYLKGLCTQYRDTIAKHIGKNEDLSEDLLAMGYKTEKEVSEAIDNSIEALEEFINDKDAKEIISDQEKSAPLDDDTVLSIISRWNLKNPKKHLMHELVRTASEGDSERKELVKGQAESIKKALISRAEKYIDSNTISEGTKKTLEDAKKALKDLDFEDGETFADKFDELYRAARKAGAEIMQKTLDEKYGFLGNDNPFSNLSADVDAELKKEGKMKSSIEAFKEKKLEDKVKQLKEEGILDKDNKIGDTTYSLEGEKLIENVPGKQKHEIDPVQFYEVQKLVKKNILKPVTHDAKGTVIYEETFPSDEKGTKRLYFIKGNKLYECSNKYYDAETKKIKTSSDKKNKAKAISAIDIEKRNRSSAKKVDKVQDSGQNAQTLLNGLKGGTYDKDWAPMLELIGYKNDGDISWDEVKGKKGGHWEKTGTSQITPQNVLSVLQQYNADSSRDFFEQLRREGGSKQCQKGGREGLLAYEVSSALLTFINAQLIRETDKNIIEKLKTTKDLIEKFHKLYHAGEEAMKDRLAEHLDSAVNALVNAYSMSSPATAAQQTQTQTQTQPQEQTSQPAQEEKEPENAEKKTK